MAVRSERVIFPADVAELTLLGIPTATKALPLGSAGLFKRIDAWFDRLQSRVLTIEPISVSTISTVAASMSMLEDVLKALDRFSLWKRLSEVPAEVDDLRQRVTAIEQKLAGKWPADVCKSCGERELRMIKSTGECQVWTCSVCHNPETRRLAQC